jgi:MEMO1 family protein
MQKYLKRIFIVAGIAFLLSFSNTGTNFQKPAKVDRQPAVAGSFYPSDKSEVQKVLAEYFTKAPVIPDQKPLALIVPHAGYIFSGNVAAAGYRQIDRNALFKHVFVIGSSHTMYFDGVSIYSTGNFITPLGKVVVDTLAGWLVKKNSFISDDSRPHLKEHSIEVQLPFLQYWLNKPFSIVPIIIGGESPATCSRLASVLEPFLNDENLFIISSDFSHYPKYADANISDNIIADAILTNSSKAFIKAKNTVEDKNIYHLETAICGWTSVLTILDMTEKHPDFVFQKLLHRNSGDAPQYGEKERVVGYYAIGLTQKTQEKALKFNLSASEKTTLLQIARQTIHEYVKNKKVPEIDEKTLSPNLKTPAGAFVTLTENGQLRGCIGNFQAADPLYKTVRTMAVEACSRDPRFDPVNASEVDRIKIEISVLTPMKRIKSVDEIELGKHGIYIKKGNRKGTFLPQVATETNWTKEEFLGHCARDKAFIGWDGWKDAEIYTYEALVFGEEVNKK